MVHNFLFHRVSPERDPLWDPMDTELFEKCVKYISEKFEVTLAEELYLRTSINPTKKYATIMFDDGYKDNFEYALPILEKYNCKASFYVVTDCIEKNQPTWTYILDYLFYNTKKEIKLDNQILEELENFHNSDLSTKDLRIDFIKRLKPQLKNTDHSIRNQIIKYFQDVYDDIQIPSMMMNWEELKTMKKMGHYIGSHTVTHPALSTISSEEVLKFELGESKKVIAEKLGHDSVTISYPVGSHNDQVMSISRQLGYKIGLAVKQDISNPKNHSQFDIPRIELYNESWFKTKLRINHTLEKIKKLIRYK